MPIRTKRQYRFQEATQLPTKLFTEFDTLNTRDPEMDLADNEVTKAQNVRYLGRGGFKKRPGSQKKGNKIGSTAILGLHSYVNKTDTAYLLATFGTELYKYTESATPVTIATSTEARASGYSKDRNVFMTTANLDTNGNPYCVVIYQNGAGLKLEWEDSPSDYATWSNTVISIDASTQTGFSGFMDSSDNIHLAFMSNANVVKYVKLTYGAGPTWTVGTAVTVAGSGASDSATYPTIYRRISDSRIIVGYRYFDGTNYSVQTKDSNDSGAIWINSQTLSTASTDSRHFGSIVVASLGGIDYPFMIYQVKATDTYYFIRYYSGSAWSPATTITSDTTATDMGFSGVVTDTTIHLFKSTSTSTKGVATTGFGQVNSVQWRQYSVVTDGANDDDIQFKDVINDTTDSTATRVSNDALSNLYPKSAEYVNGNPNFVPVIWVEGTVSPYNLKINNSANWAALTAALTTGKKMNSTYFPSSGAGGTDQIYFCNGTDVCKKWDGTTLTSANAAYTKPFWITFHENRLWLGGIDNRVEYTNNGADGFAGALPSGNNIDMPERIYWGHSLDFRLLLFGKNKIYVVQDFDYTGVNVGSEKIRPIANSHGILSGRTVKQIGQWVYYQITDGRVARTNGQWEEILTDKIQPTIDALSTAGLVDSAAGVKDQYYQLSVTGNSSATLNTWLVLDTDIYARNGGGWSIDTGKTTSCFIVTTNQPFFIDTQKAPVYFWGDASNGTVYRAEIGSSDNNVAIAMDLQTGLKNMGNVLHRKLIKDMTTYTNAAGDYNLTIGHTLFENSDTFITYDKSLNAAFPIWGSFVWGSFTWGGKNNLVHKQTLDLLDYMFKFQFYQSGIDTPVEVYSYGLGYENIKEI